MGKSIIIKGADFSSNAIKSVKHNIVYALTHCDAVSKPSQIGDGNTLRLQFTKAAGYTYPASVSVTNTTTTAAITSGVTYNASTGQLKIVGVTANITITAVGAEDLSPSVSVSPSTLSISTAEGSTGTGQFTVSASNLTGGVTLSVQGTDANKFTLSKNSLTKTEAEAGQAITVTYAGGDEGDSHSATIAIQSDGATTIYVELSGSVAEATSGVIPFEVTGTRTWSNTNIGSYNGFNGSTNLLPVKGDKIKFYQSDGVTPLDKYMKLCFYADEDLTKTTGLTIIGSAQYKKNEAAFPSGAKSWAFTTSTSTDNSTTRYDAMTQEETAAMVIKWEKAT